MFTVVEGEPFVEVSIVLFGGAVEEPFSIRVFTSDGSATGKIAGRGSGMFFIVLG